MSLGMPKAQLSAHCHVEFCPERDLICASEKTADGKRWETKGSCFEQQFYSSVCFPSAQISH